MDDGVAGPDSPETEHRPGSDAKAPPAADRVSLLVAAVFVPTVVFFLVPNDLLLRNLGHMEYSPRVVALCGGAFLAVAAISAPLFWCAGRRRWCARLVRGWLLVGLAAFLCVQARPLLTDRLDSLAATAAVEAALVLAAAAVSVRARLVVLVRLAAFVGLGLVAYTAVTHVRAYGQVRELAAARRARAAGAAAERSDAPSGAAASAGRGNVYHILLDGFQAEAFDILRATDPSVELPGFTYYPRFAGHYWLTTFSLGSLLRGRLVREGESVSAFAEDAFMGGLWKTLADAGWTVTLYPFYEAHCTPYAQNCFSASRAAQRLYGTGGGAAPGQPGSFLSPMERWLLERAVFLLEPRTLQLLTTAADGDAAARAQALRHATVPFTEMLWPLPRHAEIEEPIPGVDMVTTSVFNYRQMLEAERARPGRRQYVFVHVVCPHFPFRFDAQCGVLREEAPVEAAAYLAQARCAIRLIEELTDVLRDLGRLDDSLIVVHGDHGAFPIVAAKLVQYAPEYFPFGADNERISAMAARLDTLASQVFTFGIMQRGDVDAMRRRSGATRPGPLSLPREDWWRMPDWLNAEGVTLRRHPLLLVKAPGATAFSVAPGPVNMLQLSPTITQHAGLPTQGFAEPALSEDTVGQEPDRFYVFDGVGHTTHQLVMARDTEPPPRFRVFARDATGWTEGAPMRVEY